MEELVELLAKVPATFWGIVAGSFFSLGGVILTNRASERRMQAQFLHERDLKNRDREIALKKDVYLDTAAAISTALETIVALGNLDLLKDQVMTDIKAKMASIAKVQAIGAEETVRALAVFMAEFNSALARLSLPRISLDGQKQALANLDKLLPIYLQEPSKAAKFRELLAQRNEAAASLQTQYFEFLGQCAEESFRVTEFLPPLLIAMRAELGIPMEDAVAKEIFGTALSKQRVDVTALQKGIVELIKGVQALEREAAAQFLHPEPAVKPDSKIDQTQ